MGEKLSKFDQIPTTEPKVEFNLFYRGYSLFPLPVPKDMSITEKILRPIVESWLQEQGYYVAHEVMLSGYVDLTGCKWAQRIGRRIPPMTEIMAVELKISDIKGVLRQARNNCYFTNYSYAAMPLEKCNKMKLKTLRIFESMGVGLLGVNDNVEIIIPARKNVISHYSSNICRRLWNFKLRHKKSNS